MEKFRVFIVDDHPVVREGLRVLVETTEDLSVCGEAGDAREAWGKMLRLKPDILLLDLMLGDRMAIDFIQKTRGEFPELPILILTMKNEPLLAERALKAGADGYLLKEEASEKILAALRKVREKKECISGKVFVRMFRRMAVKEPSQERAFFDKLSNRELQIFKLLGGGDNTRKIAQDLELSVKTIETVCERIKRKLQLSNANELLRFAALWHQEF